MRIKTFLLVILIYSSAIAGGWDNSLIGARAAGIGTAFVGISDNATAIFYNTAGLSFAEPGAQLIVCGKSYYPTHTYITAAGNKVTSEISAILVELFTYYRLNNRWTLGFGMFTPYAGGGMKWPQKELGYSIEGSIGTFSFTPTISLKLFRDLALGVNFHYYYIISTQKIKDPGGKYIGDRFELPGGFSSDNLRVEDFNLTADEKGYEYAFTGSIFYKPNKKFSMGFTYHGHTDVSLNGESIFDGFAEYDIIPPLVSIPISFRGTCDSGTKFHLPASYAFGISYRIRSKFLLAVEYDYYSWSELDKVEKINSNVPIYINDVPLEETGLLDEAGDYEWIYSEPMGFNDSYYLKLGAEYLYSDKLTVRLGTSYDNGKVSKEAYSITNIDVTKLNFLAGFGYKLGIFDLNIAGFLQIGMEESVPALPNNEKYDLDSMGILASLVSSL